MAVFFLSNNADVFPGAGQNNSEPDLIYGLGGNDRIEGGAGNDTVDGGFDRDTLYGGQGDDELNAGILPITGEILDGGDGIDIAIIQYHNVVNTATDQPVAVVAVFSAGSWRTIIDGFQTVRVMNCERVHVTSGDANDSLVGGGRNDTLEAGGGHDIVRGRGGNDQVHKTWGRYDLDGGGGTDVLAISDTDKKSPGSPLLFDALSQTIQCGTTTFGSFVGFEIFAVAGTGADDTITGGNLGDSLTGFSGSDVLDGGRGDDVLRGGRFFLDGFTDGRDLLRGGAGNDDLGVAVPNGVSDGSSADSLYGGGGDDLLAFGGTPGTVVSLNGFVFDGGGGHDRLEFSGGNTFDFSGATISGIEQLAVSYNARVLLTAAQVRTISQFEMPNGTLQLADTGNAVFSGIVNAGFVVLADGGQRADLSQAHTQGPGGAMGGLWITGGTGSDTIIGTAFGDRLFGLAGDDRLTGGGGDDILRGAAGADRLAGGAGADRFEVTALSESTVQRAGRDVIADFSAAEGDRIMLVGIDAIAGTPANDAFTFIGGAEFTAAGQLRAYVRGGQTWIDANTDADLAPDLRIVLDGIHTLTDAQFWL